MRGFVTGTLFILALVLAACGGGGSSRIVPSNGSNPATPSQPAKAKTTQAKISLYIPPANKQNARSRPLYIPGNTQSFGVFVEPYPSVAPSIGPSSTPPAGLQIFPVATPSPCAVTSGGGYECTLTVTANVGSDLFVVAAFAPASPSANSVPLSAYLSGPITVSLSPAPNATPLAFTLNGVVNSVAVAVASPDPSNTPNTQVFIALVPTSAPLAISVLDTSGNNVMSPATQPFFNAAAVQASPASDGVTLALIASSACGSTASGATAQVNCVADLNDVKVVYDGSTHPDSNDHAIDTFEIYSTNAPNPTPSPASIVLASNVVTYPINDGGSYLSNAFLVPIPGSSSSPQLLYALNGENGQEIGTFTESPPPSATTPVVLNGVTSIAAIAIAPNGTLWVDESSSTIDCWSSVSAALAGAAPTTTGIAPYAPTGFRLDFDALAVDGANNVWFVGYDTEDDPDYAGYFSAASGCPATSSTVTAQYMLNGDSFDASPFVAPLSNGIAFNSGDSGLYEITTNSTSPVMEANPILGAGSNGGGVAVDPAGNIYGAFTNFNSGTGDIEWLASGSLTSLLTLVPTTELSNLIASPEGLEVFSPTGGTADRASYPDRDFMAVGFVESLHSTPATLLSVLPNAYSLYQTLRGPTGASYILYESYNNTSATYGLAIARTVNTTTWSVPVNSVNGGGCDDGALLSINERGDSGPFTVVASPLPGSANVTTQSMAGTDHDYLVAPAEATPSVTTQLTVSDKNGRTWVVPSFTAWQGESSC